MSEVDHAVEDELECQTAVVNCRGFVGEIDDAVGIDVAEESDAFGPEPDGESEEESEAGAVAEEIQFVEFLAGAMGRFVVGFDNSGFVEEFFGEDVLRDEDQSCGKGFENAEKIAGKLDAAGENDAKGQRNQREVSGF